MDLLANFQHAHTAKSGYDLAKTLDPSASGQLTAFVQSSTAQDIQTDVRYATVYNSGLELTKTEGQAWLEIYVAYWKAGRTILAAEELSRRGGGTQQWVIVYNAWREVNNALILGYNKGSFPAWTIPCLYMTAKWLRLYAIRADEQVNRANGDSTRFSQGLNDDLMDDSGGHEKLEDAGRQISRIFSLCLSDRAPIEESRKWGIYYITNLLFKTYFKLNQVSLSKNIIRSLHASASDLPPLKSYPKAHVVTFKYYVGVISFLEEDYTQAEDHLTSALSLITPTISPKNHELILIYLIPTRLLTSQRLPTAALLAPYPALRTLFSPLAACIKRGDLSGFDAAIEAGAPEFVKRRIYLTLERGRDVALRNLFRKVFLAGGFETGPDGKQVRRTRLGVSEFLAALRLGLSHGNGDVMVDKDEVECLIANLIYKNFMKGYISREKEKVVLSKAGAFPGTGV